MEVANNLVILSSAGEAAARAADMVKNLVVEAVSSRGMCNVSLAGGTTPRVLYSQLASTAAVDDLPWAEISIYFGDERDVSQDDVDSNYGMVQRVLLDNAPLDWEKVYPMRADADDIEAAASEYEAIIRANVPAGLEDIPQFDLVLLGMGGDGHTASLFPDCEAVNEESKLVTAGYVPVLGRSRMSITLPLINAARNVMFLITGDDKAEMVKRVFGDKDQSLPAARVCPNDGQIHVVLDEAAARLL